MKTVWFKSLWVLADENYWIKQIVSYWKSKLQVWVTVTTEILTPDQALGTGNAICFQTHWPCCWQNSCRVLQWNENKSKSGGLENLAPEWLKNASKFKLQSQCGSGDGVPAGSSAKPLCRKWMTTTQFCIWHQTSEPVEQKTREKAKNLCWKDLKDSGRKPVGSAFPLPADTAQPQQWQWTNKRQENTTHGS